MIADTSKSPHVVFRPAPVGQVSLTDEFWGPRLKINREITIPAQYRLLEETGRLDNFRRAAGNKQTGFQGIFFNDSDVYKWVEAASWALASGPDPRLGHILGMVVETIASAQDEDGYLNTYFTFERKAERWTNLRDMHELYCAGHLIQAAVAHWRATSDERLLAVARRLADHIALVFGPGKRSGTPGHEEIEMALIELFRCLGERKYLDLAAFFIDARGSGAAGGDEYHQDHKPFREQAEAVGHAVRAMYLYAGAADLAAETGRDDLRAALGKLWANMTLRRMYVTGGVGSRYEGEAFGGDYELPNERAYAETCAAIGSLMWNWRMLLLEGDAKYGDLMELALYNSVLSGLSQDGREYFYQNPLADDGRHRRQAWFGCACCPPNLTRTFASLPGYFYCLAPDGVAVNLYAEGTARLQVPGAGPSEIRQRTKYPWDGQVSLNPGAEGKYALYLRVPGWCTRGAEISINGKKLKGRFPPGVFARIERSWRAQDEVHLTLPMEVRRLAAHPHVEGCSGRVALSRGPMIYCAEGVDFPGTDLRNLVLPPAARLSASHKPDLLGGVTVLGGKAEAKPLAAGWTGRLYKESAGGTGARAPKRANFQAVPYFSWANRQPGQMLVWIREK